jgi:hypothetical protein
MGRPSCHWGSLRRPGFDASPAIGLPKPVRQSASVVTSFPFRDSLLPGGDSFFAVAPVRRISVCVWDTQLSHGSLAKKQERLANFLQHSVLGRRFYAKFCHARGRTNLPITKRSAWFTRSEKWVSACYTERILCRVVCRGRDAACDGGELTSLTNPV